MLYNMAVTTDSPTSSPQESHSDLPNSRGDAEDLSLRDVLATTSSSPPVLMEAPYLNVSTTGTVPKDPQTLTLHLPCTGVLSGQVHVTLNINVTAPRPSQLPTVLYFRRRKICLKGHSPRTVVVEEMPTEDHKVWHVEKLAVVVAVVAGAVVVVVTVVAAAAVRCSRIRHTKQQNPPASVQTVFTVDQKLRSVTRTTLVSPSPSSLQSPTNFAPHTSIHNKNNTPHTQTTRHTLSAPLFNKPGTQYVCPTQHPNDGMYNKLNTTFPLSIHPIPNVYNPDTSLSCSTHHTPILYTPSCHTHTPAAAHHPSAGTVGHRISGPRQTVEKLSTTSFWDIMAISGGRRAGMSDIRSNSKHLEIDPGRVRVEKLLLKGRFCELRAGVLLPNDKVMVKLIQRNAPSELTTALGYRAALRLSAIQHTAVLTVSSVSTVSPLMLVYPDYGQRNLKVFLKEHPTPLTPEDLQQMALQVAQGLAHLHSCNIPHADLAARNCLVTAQYLVRVTDGAFSSDLFPDDYQLVTGQQDDDDSSCASSSSSSSTSSSSSATPPAETVDRRPVAWMALEAITEDSISMPADVWSWGVVAWELSSLAQQPYDGLTCSHLTEYLRDGYRLAQPPTCPDVLYQLMAFCWALNPSHRPRAALLVDYLTGLTQEGVLSGFGTTAGRDAQSSNPSAVSPFVTETAGLKNELQLNGGDSSTGSSSNSSATSTENEMVSKDQNIRNAHASADHDGTYSSPSTVPDPPPGLSHFPSTVYSTPTSLAGDLPWKLPEKRNTRGEAFSQPRKDNEPQKRPEISTKDIPPPLPPANPPSSGTVALAKLRSESKVPPRPIPGAKEVPPRLPPAKTTASCPGMRKPQRPQQPLPEGARHLRTPLENQ
ncbi:Serine-threonine/tyrosine-protein kinase catalytic domain [Trinorchestia longiramus]|nr:Serine-threonine/tyrosine-protein kinase catalytic domain [Trinorchestia longiramus]